MSVLDKDTLSSILKAKNEAALLRAKANDANSSFQLLVAEALIEAGSQIEESVVCLTCGTIRHISEDICPTCNPANRHQ